MQQSIDNKLGEIKFRKKLVEQQTEGKNYFDDEFKSEEIERIIKERMDVTYKKIKSLSDNKIPITPYIEIGAERGQRSLVMENDLESIGAAVDLSFDMLKSCAYYSMKFNKGKVPLRVCTDAYNLPFKSKSIPFIFCFQTLHHFPDPTPIIYEIHRVLSEGGVFLFDEEPFKKVLHINLYKRRNTIYSDKERKKSFIKKTLDYFFSEEVCNETDYGVIENDKIPLKLWKDGLNIFYEKNIQLSSASVIKTKLFSPSNYIAFFFAYLLGGHISGTGKKSGAYKGNLTDIYDFIICPCCKENGLEIILSKGNGCYTCSSCNRNYPEVEGVLILLKDELFEKLYPDFLQKDK